MTIRFADSERGLKTCRFVFLLFLMSRIKTRNKLRSLLARSEMLRMIRARLPYRAGNWKPRAMSYWQWEDGREEAILRNTCGPSATLNSIETGTASIVWLAEPKADDICLDL